MYMDQVKINESEADLQQMGWRIADEALVSCPRVGFYSVLAAERAPLERPLSKADLAYGPILRKRRPVELQRMLLRDAQLLERRLLACPKGGEASRRAEQALGLVRTELDACRRARAQTCEHGEHGEHGGL